jgi:beta-glucosidase/6-phospho-beta-glucosidase/beta-galactosidase
LRYRIYDYALVMANIHRAHALAYERIHRVQPEAAVGIATNWVEFQAASNSAPDRLMAYSYDTVFNRATLQLFTCGNLQFPFGALAPEIPEVMQKIDFIGLNVYNRLSTQTTSTLRFGLESLRMQERNFQCSPVRRRKLRSEKISPSKISLA